MSEQAHMQKDREIAYRRLILRSSVFGLFVGTTYTIVNVLHGINAWPNVFWALCCIASVFLCLKKGSTKLAAYLFVGSSGVYAGLLVGMFSSFPFTILLWIPVYCLYAIYVLGDRSGRIMILMTFVVCAFMIHAPTQILPWKGTMSIDIIPLVTTVSLALVALATVYASSWFTSYIRDLLVAVEKQNVSLEARKIEIEELVQAKNALISIVCHDIANPLAVTRGHLELINRNPENTKNSIEKIRKSTTMIGEIISDIRKLHSLETGKVKIDLEPVCLREVFEQIKGVFEDRLLAKNLQLKIEDQTEGEANVLAERSSLGNSVISNLISNAIKFSPNDSSIVILIRKLRQEIVVSIKDSGIGIPKEIASKIFSFEGQTSRVGTMGEVGTGFGLPISKIYMQHFGGRIDFESSTEKEGSQKDHGTTFNLYFPDQNEMRET